MMVEVRGGSLEDEDNSDAKTFFMILYPKSFIDECISNVSQLCEIGSEMSLHNTFCLCNHAQLGLHII